MANLRIAGLALAFLLLLIVVFQNSEEATLRILVVRVSMPLALLLGVMLFAGAMIGLLAALWIGRRESPRPKPPS